MVMLEMTFSAVQTRFQSKSNERQVSTLLYCLGKEAEDILLSTWITEEQRKKYDDILSKFDTFFEIRKSIIFERA